VLRRKFGPKRAEITGELKELHKKGLRALYFSHSIVRVLKLKRINVEK
jgi:hypothetical protein